MAATPGQMIVGLDIGTSKVVAIVGEVREDGTLSIARSFRPQEWPPILDEAGITDARVFRAFPFRLCVERCR